ncbi:MAG: sulfatase-like hydrolase/transferase [Acidobacteriaceae bacterium]
MIKIRPWLQGVGLAMLYLLPLIAIFLAPDQNDLYHQIFPVISLTRGALLDLVFLGFLLGVALAWLNTVTSPVLRRWLWIPILFATAWCGERGIAEFLRNIEAGVRLPGWSAHLPWVVLALALVLLLFARRYYDIAIATTEVLLISAGITTALLILPRLVIASFNHAPPEQASFTHSVRQPWHSGEPRVIWVLFDELSYNQVFDHRQPSIELPAFTAFQQTSISFSQLVPVGNMTDLVVPSLLLGQPIYAIKSNLSGELLWRSSPQMGWRRFDPEATVFAAARRQGLGTGVDGWYNPYCRLLATILDRCYWNFEDFSGGSRFGRLSSERSTLQNARDALPIVPLIEKVFEHGNANQGHTSQSHRIDHDRVLKQAKPLIEDENIRFAFIHLAVPHPPGIYPDPLEGGREDYLGNLILADQILAEIRSTIEKTSSAADTILIVSSDHSWRIPFWRSSPGWTRAEERATNGGFFDKRPVLMVHFPQQTKAEQIDRPESAMIVHSLLLDLFQGRVRTPKEWFAKFRPSIGGGQQEEISEKK